MAKLPMPTGSYDCEERGIEHLRSRLLILEGLKLDSADAHDFSICFLCDSRGIGGIGEQALKGVLSS